MTATQDLTAPPAAPTCRPGGCAGLCSDDGLAAAHAAYRGRLLARARRVTVDPDLAEEAVQEAFLRGWRACSTFDPDGGPVLSWLLAITGNVAIDLVRARARRPPVSSGTSAAAEPAGIGTSELDLVLLRAELGDALRTIGNDHRAALVETILRDRSYADVAAELGIPAATLRTRVHYALRRLRAAMSDSDRGQHSGPGSAGQAVMTTGMIMGRRRSLPPTHFPTTRRTACCSS